MSDTGKALAQKVAEILNDPATDIEKMSDTPRTDAVALPKNGDPSDWVSADFARQLESDLASARAERDEAQALAERLKLEAQIHAQEARSAKWTIAEIYQVVSGATGEMGNWNGAEPVRKALNDLRQKLADTQALVREYTEKNHSLSVENRRLENQKREWARETGEDLRGWLGIGLFNEPRFNDDLDKWQRRAEKGE